MTVVVGTAGHIDHGKTSLLRALTGIDADRLPEEQARGMPIDVGYAHLALGDGTEIDFVDVPGHDRLVGNMLVGAGEIDAALVVVAADDGPRAQTIEHLQLLDALGIGVGVAVVTKIDAVDAERLDAVVAEVRALLDATTLRSAPIVRASSTTGAGLQDVRRELLNMRDRVVGAGAVDGPAIGGAARLAIDRVFTVRGRGTVVTGTLRGASIATGDVLRVVPGAPDARVRVREVQVHGHTRSPATPGRVALNVAAGDAAEYLERGTVLTTDRSVVATDRLLVALRPVAPVPPAGGPDGRRRAPVGLPADRSPVTVHIGTAHVPA
ncbi:MAG TPA: selenocysteine-specific translation elongation factor, partial [Candidatus Limnocylindrales bacterium]